MGKRWALRQLRRRQSKSYAGRPFDTIPIRATSWTRRSTAQAICRLIHAPMVLFDDMQISKLGTIDPNAHIIIDSIEGPTTSTHDSLIRLLPAHLKRISRLLAPARIPESIVHSALIPVGSASALNPMRAASQRIRYMHRIPKIP